MQWEFDETVPSYTLDAPPYRANIWRESSGKWSARIVGPDGSLEHHAFTYWEDAQVWCERKLAALGIQGAGEGPSRLG